MALIFLLWYGGEKEKVPKIVRQFDVFPPREVPFCSSSFRLCTFRSFAPEKQFFPIFPYPHVEFGLQLPILKLDVLLRT